MGGSFAVTYLRSKPSYTVFRPLCIKVLTNHQQLILLHDDRATQLRMYSRSESKSQEFPPRHLRDQRAWATLPDGGACCVRHQSLERYCPSKSPSLKSETWHSDLESSNLPVRQHSSSMADSRMRVAVAGTNALALLIAAFVVRDTSHQIIVLSRAAQPELSDQGYQVLVVNYENEDSLQHAVTGVDTIISTVTGSAQLNLLKAAVAQRVRRFAPAEFEGPLRNRPGSNMPDHLDRGKRDIRSWLDYYSNHIQYTVFVCGVLYERFAPYGLHNYRLGMSTELGNEGDYIVNVRTLRATAPLYNVNNEPVTLCLTAAQDVARLVVRSLDMASWPRELCMVGEKMTVQNLLDTVVRVRGKSSLTSIIQYTPTDLTTELTEALQMGDTARQMRAHDHIATVAQRYLFRRPGNLREMYREIEMIKFENWLHHQWENIPVEYE